ncbi:DNA invertase Pin-like site-specific DNA recombinase [Nitrobacter vulgaris]|uniref:recombinase family protein n=1 Tax=Nitrobacter vulgaris TaxID=29421 RepID=UPI00286682F9|nr:recombinase family protein [Nitrobacter vulgaris]MDR6306038.1 DNA invertase Pin-like site-specific DNA recombinase [Nitrobacter vulgaris]
MRDRLTALGWSHVETVDDDLSRSATGGVARAGFDRMVAEVCLGKVGAVAAREVSRFARNSRDWQQLIEMCRVVDTVLIVFRRGVSTMIGKGSHHSNSTKSMG